MTHFLPTTPITTESDAQKAARASAVAIVLGVIVGIVSAVWLAMNPEVAQQAIAAAEAKTPGAGAIAGGMMQGAIWFSYAMIVIQGIFAVIQWREPRKWIAILFIILIALGLLSALAAPFAASMNPNAPATPLWQTVLAVIVMAIQIVLHVTGLRGIGTLEAMQMEAAR